MSAISEKVRIAIFDKLNVSGVTTLATGGIHYKLAPEGASTPYVVFNRIPVDVTYAFANNLVGERDIWLIKALTDENSSTTKEPSELAEDILTACETAIGGTLTLSGNTVSMARRVREIPDYTETLSDRVIHHHGFHLEVFAA